MPTRATTLWRLSRDLTWRLSWRCLLLPLAALVAMMALASAQADPAEAAETRLLALIVAGAVAAFGALADERHSWPEVLTVASIAMAWTLHGPQRGTALTLLLLAGAAVVWRDTLARGAALFVPLAVLTQLLLRPDLLMPPYLETRTLVSLLILPTIAGAALGYLSTSRLGGRLPALIAGMATVILAPGWNVTVTAALVAVASGVALCNRDALVVHRAMGALGLAAVISWDPPLGLIFALTVLVAEASGRRAPLIIGAMLLGVIGFLLVSLQGDLAAALSISVLHAVLILPMALVAAPRRASRLGLACVAAALADGDPQTLAAALAVLALGLPAVLDRLQLHLSVLWLLVAGSVGAYPWLRAEPTSRVFDQLIHHIPTLALVPLALLLTLVLAIFALGRVGRPSVILWATLLVAIMAAARPAPLVILDQVLLLTPNSPRQQAAIDEEDRQPVRQVMIESSLIHGVGLRTGTPVALLEIEDAEGVDTTRWSLKAGTDTADWAAGRLDVMARPGFEAPSAWCHRVSVDGRFFEQRFRAIWTLDTPVSPRLIRVQRHPQSGDEVWVRLERVELQP